MRFRNHHAGCCGFSPTRPDGTEWPHVLALHDGSTVHADTPAEVLDELIDGYSALPEAERLAARARAAESLAQSAQEARVDEAVRRGLLDPSDADDAALLDILRAPKGLSLFLEAEDAPGEQAAWLPLPELVLLTTSYAPHTAYPPIGGNVVWIDPSDEQAYLDSLRAGGVHDYWRAQRP